MGCLESCDRKLSFNALQAHTRLQAQRRKNLQSHRRLQRLPAAIKARHIGKLGERGLGRRVPLGTEALTDNREPHVPVEDVVPVARPARRTSAPPSGRCRSAPPTISPPCLPMSNSAVPPKLKLFFEWYTSLKSLDSPFSSIPRRSSSEDHLHVIRLRALLHPVRHLVRPVLGLQPPEDPLDPVLREVLAHFAIGQLLDIDSRLGRRIRLTGIAKLDSLHDVFAVDVQIPGRCLAKGHRGQSQDSQDSQENDARQPGHRDVTRHCPKRLQLDRQFLSD